MTERDEKGRFKPRETGGTIHGLTLPVSATVADILAAVHFGHAQALEMYRALTQPPPQPSQAPPQMIFGETEEEDTEPGFIDVQGLWSVSPEARQAILSRAGLQVQSSAPEPEDPTIKEVDKLRTQAQEEG